MLFQRAQLDLEEQRILEAAGTTFDPREDVCRHELTPETDINRLMARYEPFELPLHQVFYGERDYQLDYQTAMEELYRLQNQARARWQGMTKAERDQYGDFKTFMTALEPRPVPQAGSAVPNAPEGTNAPKVDTHVDSTNNRPAQGQPDGKGGSHAPPAQAKPA